MLANTLDQLFADVALFGDYPWGNELLELPSNFPKPQCGHRARKRGRQMRFNLLFGNLPAHHELQNPDLKVLHWFRWITGHQVVFLFWRALAVCLQEVDTPSLGARKENATRHAVHLLKGYTCMLLYSGSCTQELYQSTYRVFMGLHHEAFSGKWAFEYSRIPKLLGEALRCLKECGRDDLFEALFETQKENCLTHEAVANKLVPDGPSLLQRSNTEQTQPLKTERRHRFFFDSFFLVKRTRISGPNLYQALLRRIKPAMVDISQNRLYSEASKGKRSKWNISANEAEIIRFYEDNILELLSEATRSAAYGL